MSPTTTLSPEQRRQLIAKALQARDGSYSPYSHFRVGACLLGHDDGQYTTGANVENASYGVTICAERTAIVKAVASLNSRSHQVSGVTFDLNGVCSPCGLCRQTLREFCPSDMPILLVPANYSEQTNTVTAREAKEYGDEGVLVATTLDEVRPSLMMKPFLSLPNQLDKLAVHLSLSSSYCRSHLDPKISSNRDRNEWIQYFDDKRACKVVYPM
ncbi:BQ2448_5183 [Microbotryum intermedium]|uniref:cytidine deaminase n=1 Tax=Microbotryum intermedium TaxID=269621 RepID=A0A238F0B5_9BASI|nr:BQ2448_5183 [Microbotryum intermedium]